MFVTSNRSYRWGENDVFKDGYTATTSHKQSGVIIADMDTSDTAYVKCGSSVTMSNGGNVEHSYFSGVLIG